MKPSIETRRGPDRLRYVILFEVFLIAILAPLGALVLERSLLDFGALGLVLSLKAMVVNLVYNCLFDRLDARAGRIPSERSWAGRAIHALGLEFGLVLTSLPIVMWWLDFSLWQALLMDLVVEPSGGDLHLLLHLGLRPPVPGLATLYIA